MSASNAYNGIVGFFSMERIHNLFMNLFVAIPTLIFLLVVLPYVGAKMIGPDPSGWKIVLLFLAGFGTPLALLLTARLFLQRKTFTCKECRQEARYGKLQYRDLGHSISYLCPHCKEPTEYYLHPMY